MQWYLKLHFFYIYSFLYICLFLLIKVELCAPPGFVLNDDNMGFVNGRCCKLLLYPIGIVDKEDQYRYEYNDASFTGTYNLGSSVTITCTKNGQPGIVEGYDNDRVSIMALTNLNAICTTVAGSHNTWTILGRGLQYLGCRV